MKDFDKDDQSQTKDKTITEPYTSSKQQERHNKELKDVF